MAKLIEINTYHDERGTLSVIEKNLPFEIKRVYYMYDILSKRGGHRHKKTVQALIALNGSCEIFVDNNKDKEYFLLDSPSKCLIVGPEDWHTMDKFAEGTVLLVLASEFYDRNDYIEEEY